MEMNFSVVEYKMIS